LSVNSKPWKNESFHKTFEEADSTRNKLLEVWSDNPKHEGMQVKVKFMSSKSGFAVKTRLHPDFEPKKEKKKSGKGKQRNKKDTKNRELDTSPTV
jgi:hypothetical protein|tara:strand:+ start:1109 stop:1393 length:285 start_codon:yes stop_codon:yes gene_type:complete